MAKELTYSEDARKKLLAGVDKLANTGQNALLLSGVRLRANITRAAARGLGNLCNQNSCAGRGKKV